jgi:von Willebrand factor type A domain
MVLRLDEQVRRAHPRLGDRRRSTRAPRCAEKRRLRQCLLLVTAEKDKKRLGRATKLCATLSCIAATAAVISLAPDSSPGAASASTQVYPPGRIDIELAFDTTGSMGPSIEQAKRNGATIVTRVRDAFPDTHFAVVSFRDYGNPSGVYEVLQPMTGDSGAVQAALAKLRTARNSSPLNSSGEEYNLAFQKSYADAAIGWRSAARKVVVVVGDGQPHGAGTTGIAGCSDASSDYYGLNTADVLAGMRAAQRTLLMIRQVSPGTTVSLGCYQAMADRAFVGGAARNGGDSDLAGPIVALIQNAVAPVTVHRDLGLALPGRSVGYTATVSNPGSFALSLRSLAVTLPAGFRHRSGSTGAVSLAAGGATTVNVPIGRVLRPSQTYSVHFRATAPRRLGRYAAQAAFQLQLPGGHGIDSTGGAPLRVIPRLRDLVVTARASRRLRSIGNVSLGGAVRIAFPPRARSLAKGRLVARRLVLRRGSGRSITLRVRSYRVTAFGSPTVLRLRLEVERVRGLRACSRGALGSATIVDDQSFHATGHRRDRLVSTFGASCRIAAVRWSNVGAGRATVTATAR